MNRTLRIKADIGSDKVINVNLSQDIDLYEILSLKLSQRSMYKRFSANYGVVVGRVLANDAFGVPNVKVSIFVPLSTEDEFRSDIRAIYPYRDVTDYNSENIRYNTLPNYQVGECHRAVGTMPSKRLVLDNDTILEVYDKYYRYTTTTNKAGDYMIFGVPTGNHMLHTDVDLSDIGILSQKPRDFIYKGYSIDLFESPSQFKKSTNLDSLPQILSQTTSVNVYPFWGDKDTGEISITRKDISLQYKFESTCVFMGSIMTDNSESSIGHTCIPDEKVGDASQLVPSEGTIEMIRKTDDDRVEEFPIKGNRLIDSDGVFCYQIPMNLDYVGMDEKGNIVPTDNPKKGIATRARVRFRFTLNETGESTMARHKARYLVPNNPQLYESSDETKVSSEVPMMPSSYIFDNEECYEFGSRTPDSCFRDLYWNKVYSIKNYIPRVQKSEYENTSNYLAIKGVNKLGAKKSNLIPYNKINLNFSVSSQQLLDLANNDEDGRRFMHSLAWFWNFIRNKYPDYNLDAINEQILEANDSIGLDFYNDWLNGCLYFPSWYWYIREKNKKKNGESVYDSQFCECKYEGMESVDGPLFLYNNCSLVYKNKDLVINDKEEFTSKVGSYHRINFGSLSFLGGLIKKTINKDNGELFYYTHGNITSTQRIQVPKNKVIASYEGETEYVYKYVRLFATDIILLGSLVDCDIDGIPQLSYDIPSTTCNIPPMGAYKKSYDSDTKETSTADFGEEAKPDISETGDEYGDGYTSFNGMNWGYYWTKKWGDPQRATPWYKMIVNERKSVDKMYRYTFGSGLFFGLAQFQRSSNGYWAWFPCGILSDSYNIVKFWENIWKKIDFWKLIRIKSKMPNRGLLPVTDIKSCVNLERICELGVTLDSDVKIEYTTKNGGHIEHITFINPMDGMITDKELIGYDARALFASLNANKLIGVVTNPITGYKTYKIDYYYPTNFDGRLDNLAPKYTNLAEEGVEHRYGLTEDFRNLDYLDFRFGSKGMVIVDEGSTTKNDNYFDYTAPPRRASTHNHGWGNPGSFSGGSRSNDESNTTYSVDTNGELYYTTEIMNGTRHFYGVANKNTRYYDEYHAFPLYNNSFYFFFGLNAGSTAIDKLYKNFYSYCPENSSDPFTISPIITPTNACEENGKIAINLMGLATPYDMYVKQGDRIVTAFTSQYIQTNTVSNLASGLYNIHVSDANGNEVDENVTVKKYPLIINYNVVKNISSGHTGDTCEGICVDIIGQETGEKFPQYGIVEFNTYELEGSSHTITTLTKVSDGVYRPNGDMNVKLFITPDTEDESTISDFTCGCSSIGEITENKINFYRPGVFKTTFVELCENDSDTYYNTSESTFTIDVDPDIDHSSDDNTENQGS